MSISIFIEIQNYSIISECRVINGKSNDADKRNMMTLFGMCPQREHIYWVGDRCLKTLALKIQYFLWMTVSRLWSGFRLPRDILRLNPLSAWDSQAVLRLY